jgi:hypothetical protein
VAWPNRTPFFASKIIFDVQEDEALCCDLIYGLICIILAAVGLTELGGKKNCVPFPAFRGLILA